MLLTEISVKTRNKTEAYYIALNKQGVRDPLLQIFPLMGHCTSFYSQYNQDLTEWGHFFFLLKEFLILLKGMWERTSRKCIPQNRSNCSFFTSSTVTPKLPVPGSPSGPAVRICTTQHSKFRLTGPLTNREAGFLSLVQSWLASWES